MAGAREDHDVGEEVNVADVDLEINGSNGDFDYNFFGNEGGDDELFEQNVVSIYDGDKEIRDDVYVEDSDDFISLSDSDDDEKKERKFKQFNHLVDFKGQMKLSSGMIFPSNSMFRDALKQYTIENGVDYYYLHNDKTRVYVYCENRCACKKQHVRKMCKCETIYCQWKALASEYSSDGSFQLKTFEPKHDCGFQCKNTKVTSVWLANKYLEHFRDDPTWKLTTFMAAVRKELGVIISYNQAWKATFRALLKTQGDASEQYAKVWDYAATILARSPGSSAVVKVNQLNPEKPLFERLYISFDAWKKGFIMGCRPIVGLDGYHLTGAYK